MSASDERAPLERWTELRAAVIATAHGLASAIEALYPEDVAPDAATVAAVEDLLQRLRALAAGLPDSNGR